MSQRVTEKTSFSLLTQRSPSLALSFFIYKVSTTIICSNLYVAFILYTQGEWDFKRILIEHLLTLHRYLKSKIHNVGLSLSQIWLYWPKSKTNFLSFFWKLQHHSHIIINIKIIFNLKRIQVFTKIFRLFAGLLVMQVFVILPYSSECYRYL